MRSKRGAWSIVVALALVAATTGVWLPRARADQATHVTFSAELGATALTGHPTYLFGTGTSLGLGVAFRDRLSLEWTTSQYAMQAQDGLHATNTLGRLGANAVMLRLRLPLLPVTVGGGLGQLSVPLLTLDEDGAVTTTSVRQLGALAAGALLLVRSSKFAVYAEGRLFLPLLKEIPPEHVPAQGDDAVYPSTESEAYPAVTVGLGVRIRL